LAPVSVKPLGDGRANVEESDADEVRDGFLVGGTSVGAWLLFGVGLLSPLTPSEGNPGWIEILIFVGGPVFLLVGVALRTRRWWAWFFALVQSALIVFFAVRLLRSIWQ
jgi:hypothetical protein